MTLTPMIWHMTNRLLLIMVLVSSQIVGAAEPLPDIPSRVVRQNGKFVLSPHLGIDVQEVSAGKWGRIKLIMRRDGKEVWVSPNLDFLVTTTKPPGVAKKAIHTNENKLIREDVDGNGKVDWIYVTDSKLFGSYNVATNDIRTWSDDETREHLVGSVWADYLGERPAGFIVLDDEKTVYVFNYNEWPDPLQHGYSEVRGKLHFPKDSTDKKSIFRSSLPRLQVSSLIPARIWKNLRQLIESRVSKMQYPAETLEEYQSRFVNWDAKQIPFGDDWKLYFAEGLAMYQRAKTAYARKKGSMAKEDLLTKKELDVFDFRKFFETFPFDQIDPENYYPEYTAMLNDYAFYLMAPADRVKYDGADSRRDPVEESVLAMLAHVIRRDPGRTAAYLNLGDALWRNGEDRAAAGYYRKYQTLLQASNAKVKPPKRVLERTKSFSAL